MQEELILSVELDAGKSAERLDEMTKSLVDLKKQQEALTAANKAGQISNEDYAKTMAALKDQISWTTKQQKDLVTATKLAKSTTDQYGDSLDEERRKLADMQKAYGSLTKEQRDSKAGQAFRAEIKKQSDAVKSLEQNIGDARRNVGNYAEAFKKAGGGVASFGGKLKAFFANPWLALFTAIAAAVKGLIDAFRGSEDRMREMQKAFAPLRAAVDVIKQLFDGWAKSLSGVVQVALGKVSDGVGWLAKQLDKLGNVFGKKWGLSEALEQATENQNKLTAAEQKYVEHKRRWVEQSAKLDKQAAEAQAVLADKVEASAEERMRALDALAEVRRKQTEGEVALAKEYLRILELDAERSENDAAANDALAEARAAVTRAEATQAQAEREIAAQRTAILKQVEAAANKAEAAETKAAAASDKAAREQLKLDKSALDLHKQQQLAALGSVEEIAEKDYDAKRAYYERVHELETQYFNDLLALYEQDSADYNNVLAQKEAADRAYTDKAIKMANEHAEAERDAAAKAKQAHATAFSTIARSAGDTFRALGELVEEDEKNTEEASNLKKATAIAGIITDQASAAGSTVAATVAAIEGATKAAAQTGIAAPFTTPAFITEMVGIVAAASSSAIAGIVQAKQLANSAGNFATGGVVGGYTSTPALADNTFAHVGTGEMILNARQQSTLFDAIQTGNLGVDYETMAQVLARAVSAQPAPVMVYSEYQQFKGKVSTFNEFAKI